VKLSPLLYPAPCARLQRQQCDKKSAIYLRDQEDKGDQQRSHREERESR